MSEEVMSQPLPGPGVQCYRCQEYGHMAKKCQNPRVTLPHKRRRGKKKKGRGSASKTKSTWMLSANKVKLQDLVGVGNNPDGIEVKEVAPDDNVLAEFVEAKSEKMTTEVISASDSGITSQFCSGDSASPVKRVKTECGQHVRSD